MMPMHLDGCVTSGTRESWATLSACDRYRYALGRAWDDELDGRPTFSIIMLNPSTADALVDDPTIRKCIHFAKQEGCGALLVRNLFAWRATDPTELRRVPDPIGPLNESVLGINVFFGMRVLAWGQLGSKWLRGRAVRPLSIAKMRNAQVLALTERGYDRSSIFADRHSRQPRHPLYLPNSTRIQNWVDAAREA